MPAPGGLLLIAAVAFPSEGSQRDAKGAAAVRARQPAHTGLWGTAGSCELLVDRRRSPRECRGRICGHHSKIRKQRRKMKGLACGHPRPGQPVRVCFLVVRWPCKSSHHAHSPALGVCKLAFVRTGTALPPPSCGEMTESFSALGRTSMPREILWLWEA